MGGLILWKVAETRRGRYQFSQFYFGWALPRLLHVRLRRGGENPLSAIGRLNFFYLNGWLSRAFSMSVCDEEAKSHFLPVEGSISFISTGG
jgi:hypothetical protein